MVAGQGPHSGSLAYGPDRDRPTGVGCWGHDHVAHTPMLPHRCDSLPGSHHADVRCPRPTSLATGAWIQASNSQRGGPRAVSVLECAYETVCQPASPWTSVRVQAGPSLPLFNHCAHDSPQPPDAAPPQFRSLGAASSQIPTAGTPNCCSTGLGEDPEADAADPSSGWAVGSDVNATISAW